MDEPIRILCVDDEPNVLRSLERTFIDEDYEILKACSGEDGLQILHQVAPVQIIISDYRMPGMSGIDFLREVRNHWPWTVRIVLSGYADTATVVSAINEGQIYKFIPKPWNTDELRVTVENSLERYFLNKKNRELNEELKQKNDELNRINSSLERIIAENTAEIMLQNRILRQSQTILHHAPIGIIASTCDGILIQCNSEAETILSCRDLECPGTDLRDLLPETLLALSGSVGESPSSLGEFQLGNSTVQITVRRYDDNEGGKTIFALHPVTCFLDPEHSSPGGADHGR